MDDLSLGVGKLYFGLQWLQQSRSIIVLPFCYSRNSCVASIFYFMCNNFISSYLLCIQNKMSLVHLVNVNVQGFKLTPCDDRVTKLSVMASVQADGQLKIFLIGFSPDFMIQYVEHIGIARASI